MKPLNVLGIFFTTATLMTASTALWNHFPGRQERQVRADSAALTVQMREASADLMELTALIQQAFQQHDVAAWLKGRTMGGGLTAKINDMVLIQTGYIQEMDSLAARRHAIERPCFWAAAALAGFSLLTLLLSAFNSQLSASFTAHSTKNN
ncbi:MAG: hypothetical protein ACLQAH_15045 [Limisphaerales bacterium]